jgi:hypothetical protein
LNKIDIFWKFLNLDFPFFSLQQEAIFPIFFSFLLFLQVCWDRPGTLLAVRSVFLSLSLFLIGDAPTQPLQRNERLWKR